AVRAAGPRARRDLRQFAGRLVGPRWRYHGCDLANRRISSFTLEGELTGEVSIRVPQRHYVTGTTVRPGMPELSVTYRAVGRGLPRPGEPATSGYSAARVDATSGEITDLAPLPDPPPPPPAARARRD